MNRQSAMIRDQVVSKAHWGCDKERILPWLRARGIVGDEAEELWEYASSVRRKEIRTRALLGVLMSGTGVLLAVLMVAIRMMGQDVLAGRVGGAVLVVGLCCLSWLVKELWTLIVGSGTGAVD